MRVARKTRSLQFSLGPGGIGGRDGNGGPFGFVFSRSGHLIATQVNGFTVSSYRIQDDNTVTPISGPLPTGSDFPCWLALHEDTAFISSFGAIAVFNNTPLDISFVPYAARGRTYSGSA
jgi:hypothetical protein